MNLKELSLADLKAVMDFYKEDRDDLCSMAANNEAVQRAGEGWKRRILEYAEESDKTFRDAREEFLTRTNS